MVKLCDAAGYVLQVELGVRVNKPRLAAVWPEHRELQRYSVEWARRNIGLICGTRGQSWIARHRDTESNTVELRFVLWKPVEKTGRQITLETKTQRNLISPSSNS